MEKIIKSFSIKKLHLRGHYLLIAAILIAIPIGFTIVQIQRVVSQDVNQNQLTDRKNEITNQVVTFDEETITEGIYGINIHRSNPNDESYYVNKWSAGCQVFKKVADFNEFMDICRKARDIWGNSFSYTLIESEDLA